ncbi:hypothetical protein Mal35_28890 [Gimesia maris]|uniref:hypothetical protein n=1 Tax=Gimesia maris TaxID=122 RepID=UPI00118B35D2|nr:hypothetical protein [Gimesia maris]QDT79431.1 hypothetical protein Mal35_28890 [Gimesia maris]
MKRTQSHQTHLRFLFSLTICAPLFYAGGLQSAFADAVEAAKPGAKQVKAPLIIPPVPKDNLSQLKDDAWLKDPFKNIQTDVKSVITDFDKGQTTQPAKTTQPRIISRLDTLVEMLEKSCKKGGGAAGANPSRPANSSTLGKGPGGEGELKAPDKKGRNWADLTPKQREKILQSRTEGFPPGYEDILADYFRRLARNQAVDKTQPTSEKQD